MEAAMLILIMVLLGAKRGSEGAAPEQPPAQPPEPPADAGEGWPADRVVPADEIRAIATGMGLSPDWGTFLAAVADGESRRHLAALNEGDASAALRAYERNVERYGACAWPKTRYTVGAIGLYQMLPANGMAAWWGTEYQCGDPWLFLTDPVLATIAAVQYARRVMGWDDWAASDKTWYAMRRAWAAPTWADESKPATEKRFREALQRIGVDVSFAEKKVDSLPAWNVLGLTEARLAQL